MHKKSFGVFVISLLMFSLFVGVVSAQLGPSSDPGTSAKDFCAPSANEVVNFFCRLFGDWSTGAGISQNIAKLFIAVIIGILVYGVSDNLPGLKGDVGSKPFLRFLISVIVAFLGTAYLNGTETILIISQYSALGFALGAVLPWLILSFFTYDILSKAGDSRHHIIPPVLLARALWFFFVVFMLYRIVTVVAPAVGGIAKSFSDSVGIGYWVFTVLGFLFLLTMGTWSHFVLRQSLKDTNTRVSATLIRATAVNKADDRRARALAGESEASLDFE